MAIKKVIEKFKPIENIISAFKGSSASAKPIYMQIEPTNRCNLSCVMCGRNILSPTTIYRDLDNTNFVSIIDQMDSVKFLNLSGWGEPFMNADITDMFAYAKNKQIDVETISNLTLITKEKANKTVKSGLDRIYTSIDSAVPTTYKQIRGGGLEVALRGMDNLINAKKQLFSETPKIIINTVLMKQNINEIDKVLRLAAEYKVDVNFKSLGVNNSTTKSFEIDYPYEQINILKKQANDLNVRLTFTIKAPRYNIINCYSIWFGGFIDCNGNLYPCCNFYNSPVMGNVLKDSFENVWNSDEFIRFRSCIVKSDLSLYSEYVNRTCKECNLSFNDKLHKIGKYFR